MYADGVRQRYACAHSPILFLAGDTAIGPLTAPGTADNCGPTRAGSLASIRRCPRLGAICQLNEARSLDKRPVRKGPESQPAVGSKAIERCNGHTRDFTRRLKCLERALPPRDSPLC